MTLQSYILLAVAAILATAWALLLMHPRQTRKTATPKPDHIGSLSIGLECDSTQALAELAKVSAALERIADLQAKTNLRGLAVRTYEEAPAHKRPAPPPSRVVQENQARPKHRTPEKPKRR